MNVRPSTLLAIAAFCFGFALAVCSAQAQTGSLLVQPDTLFYTNQGPNEDITIRNTGADTVRVDSLRFLEKSATVWGFILVVRDSTYGGFSSSALLGNRYDAPAFTLRPGDEARLEHLHYDPCGACKQGTAGETASYVMGDSLLVYASDRSGGPYVVPVDFRFYVGAEQDEPEPALPGLTVYPNPTRHQAHVEVSAGRTGRYVLAVYDLLGRAVHVTERSLIAGERWAYTWEPPAHLASGLYLVRVSGSGADVRTRTLHVVK